MRKVFWTYYVWNDQAHDIMSRVPQADLHFLCGPHRLLLLLQFKFFKRCNDIVRPLKGIVTERSRSLTLPVSSIFTSEAKALERLQIVPFSRQGISGQGLQLREALQQIYADLQHRHRALDICIKQPRLGVTGINSSGIQILGGLGRDFPAGHSRTTM